MKNIFIVDPGHRVDTPGKSANGLYEYEFNNNVAKRLEKKLLKYGEVYFTIETEKHPYSELTANGRTQNLGYRTSKANSVYWNAIKEYGKNNFKIVFISIHANAFSNPSASGYEIFVYKHGSEAHELAKAVHRQAQLVLDVGTDIKDRGIKEANFYVLKNTIMPAVLIEHEFYTNPQAVNKLKSDSFREQCAEHLYKGILDYMGIQYQYEETAIGGGSVTYRIRKTWEDSKSQKGAYSNLDNAIIEAKKYDGYNVYDDKGNQVYPEIKEKNDDEKHWAYKYYKNLKDKGINIAHTRFDDNITRGELFKLLDIITGDNKYKFEEKEVDEDDDRKKENPDNIENPIEVVESLVYKELIKNGSCGNHVKELQQVLNKLGYNVGAPDGIAGNNTISKIKQFQIDYNLNPDGIAGQSTYQKLNEVLKTGEKPVKKYDILRPDKQSTIVKIKKEFISLVDIIVANTSSGRETLASMQKRTNVDFIINGGLYWTDKNRKSHSLNLLLNEGKQIQAGVYSKFGLRTFKDGTFDFDWYKWSNNLKDMIGGSPALVIDRKINIDGKLDNSLQNARHPRSVISDDKDNFYMITVDGRRASQGLKGMTINELAKFMLELDIRNAIDLDGGGSTKTMFRDQTLNNPSENNRGLNNSVGIKLKEV